jgi:hypothetical protein
LKPGAFKLWVNCIFQLVQPHPAGRDAEYMFAVGTTAIGISSRRFSVVGIVSSARAP